MTEPDYQKLLAASIEEVHTNAAAPTAISTSIISSNKKS